METACGIRTLCCTFVALAERWSGPPRRWLEFAYHLRRFYYVRWEQVRTAVYTFWTPDAGDTRMLVVERGMHQGTMRLSKTVWLWRATLEQTIRQQLMELLLRVDEEYHLVEVVLGRKAIPQAWLDSKNPSKQWLAWEEVAHIEGERNRRALVVDIEPEAPCTLR
eukprot:TRINITY_DN3015_c0_g2_i7.p2 TRINITY_DN3015_c0_g2~~TRINITY_DN3015_c0_g2_i7.p2  ORF type:complete len:165 (-),score=43.30 TRINITY_DN3015_c0_g2_i7:7-501(-)